MEFRDDGRRFVTIDVLAAVMRQTALRIPGQKGLPQLATRFFRGVGVGLADGSIRPQDGEVAEEIIHLVQSLAISSKTL